MTAAFTFLHISDLHFGRIDASVFHKLATFISSHQSDIGLTIVTGDLTQRAKKKQFLESVSFLKSLPCPVFVVPGNHDVPLYNLFLRFFLPYKKFLRYVWDFSADTFVNEAVAVYGIWSLDRFTVKDGALKRKDIKKAQEFFRKEGTGKFKILAAHHPLDLLKTFSKDLSGAIDLLLSGHGHQSGIKFLGTSGALPFHLAAGTTTLVFAMVWRT